MTWFGGGSRARAPRDGESADQPADQRAPGIAAVSVPGHGSVGVGGDNNGTITVAAPVQVRWPVAVGDSVPAEPSAFQQRTAVRARVDAARERQGTAALTQVLSGGGGVGKTQLAAAYARQALVDGIELVGWINASDPARIAAAYAEGAAQLLLPGVTGEDNEADARRFLRWLASAPVSWLIVLDGIEDVNAVGPWWPPTGRGGNGRCLATTRQRGATVTGAGRVAVDMDTYTGQEAEEYLVSRLTDANAAPEAGAPLGELAAALGRLPLALSHAAAYVINQGISCARYLELLTDERKALADVLPPTADTERYGREVAAALLLSVRAAAMTAPVGLAIPAMTLAAMFDPAGHPDSVWRGGMCAEYLRLWRDERLRKDRPGSSGEPVDADTAWAAMRVLHNYSLIDHDPSAGPRAVRVHALTGRATRENVVDGRELLTLAAGAALMELWPDDLHDQRALTSALIDNAEALAANSGDALWQSGAYALLYRAGMSQVRLGTPEDALAFWRRTAEQSARRLGPGHASVVSARTSLLAALINAGRFDEGIEEAQSVLETLRAADGDRLEESLAVSHSLAALLQHAGRLAEAITLQTEVVADARRALGSDDLLTLNAVNSLGHFLYIAEQPDRALEMAEQVIAACPRPTGNAQTLVLSARNNRAVVLSTGGRIGEAIEELTDIVARRTELLGHEHAETLVSRRNLAMCHGFDGRLHQAERELVQVIRLQKKHLGPQHPDTTASRQRLELIRVKIDSDRARQYPVS
ncbi:tetratricopeptide repeat protein [Streptomyces sp. V4-01]|uniref:Tetratricopeptide repeat protein n=1 Tax=Actinacidiphila polyblastidii TaxID=3110430 RepID=A0ABU7PKI5_9ACTN|nr:tetratricopeptide repeat protein [Streptomyces sp. V4-01]